MNTKKYGAGGVLTAVALIGLVGCGSSDNGSQAASTPHSSMTMAGHSSKPTPSMSSSTPTPAALITIKNYGYTESGPVSPGASVMVKNEDAENHTVTADSGSAFDVTADAGGSVTFTAPMKPGSYPFHCTFHSEMHGTLVVK